MAAITRINFYVAGISSLPVYSGTNADNSREIMLKRNKTLIFLGVISSCVVVVDKFWAPLVDCKSSIVTLQIRYRLSIRLLYHCCYTYVRLVRLILPVLIKIAMDIDKEYTEYANKMLVIWHRKLLLAEYNNPRNAGRLQHKENRSLYNKSTQEIQVMVFKLYVEN